MKFSLGVVLAGLALPGVAAARPNTYCVGGYSGRPPFVLAACDTAAVRAQHDRWHFHMFLRGPGGCLACYDEHDQTCETVFLRENRGRYTDIDAFDCAVLGPEDNSIHAHVIDGQAQVAPPPPPAKLKVSLEDLAPGPYTTGDLIQATGAVRDQDGHLRPVSGGDFVLTDASGQTQRIPGTLGADGTVRGELRVPASSSIEVVFEPDALQLAPGETLEAAASQALSLNVEVCAYHARITAPEPGAALTSGQALTLRAALVEGPASPGAAMVFTLSPAGGPPQEIPASADGSGFSAPWTPPSSKDPLAVALTAAGRAGDRVICPAREDRTTVSVSDLGLGYDLSGLPEICYAGLPCRGAWHLIRPEPGPGRAATDALLADPAATVVLLSGDEVLATVSPDPSDRYAVDTTFESAGNQSWRLEIRRPAGTVASPSHEVRVRPPLVLRLPTEIDFGTVPAGTGPFDACQKLDFSDSQAAGEHRWALSLDGLGDCQARPRLAFRNALGAADAVDLSPDHPVEALDPQRRWLDLCLDVPRCAGEQSPPEATLVVRPLTPEFAAQTASVRLRWRVSERSWLSCQSTWLWPSVGGIGGLFLLFGWTRPRRFRPEAAIAVAGSERGLRTAAWVSLLDCPGSRPGFYRDARLGLHADGAVNGRLRHALLVLRATRGGAVIDPVGGLEVQDRRTLRWTPVTERGHVPTRNAIYRAGGTYLRVEGG